MATVAPEEALGVLRRIWCEVLAVDDVPDDVNFFNIGGDSLLALEVAARARKVGLPVPASGVFRHPILVDLAQVAAQPEKSASGQHQ